MKIIKIRLHPFARFNDLTLDLSHSLVVIHNLNEAGKSTLRKGIFHALFTSTDQTRKKCEDSLGAFFPRPAGDYVKVTLEFECDGSTWTLTKQWGAAAQSLLTNGPQNFADPTTIHHKLGQMLTHNVAAYEHVLFTGQGELERTIQTIAQNNGLRDVRDLFRADDIDEQALRIRLDEKVKLAFGRWDSNHDRPETDNAGERGITKPWKQDVGSILKAWYDWKVREAEHAKIVEIEKEIDSITGKLADQHRDLAEAKVFVDKYDPLSSDLQERKMLEEKVSRLEREVKGLKDDFTSWPQAVSAVAAWDKQKPQLDAKKKWLESERSDEEKRIAGQSTRAIFERIKTAKQDYKNAVAKSKMIQCPDKELIKKVLLLSAEITNAENKIAARKLTWSIDTENPGHVMVQNGIGHEESLDLSSGSVQGEAEARVRVTVGGLTLTVNSGSDDAESILRKLEENRTSLADLLRNCHVSTKAEIDDLVKRHDQADFTVRLKKAAYKATLDGKDFTEWKDDIKKLDSLRQTRDTVTINAAIDDVVAEIAREQQKVDTYKTKIDEWTKLHGHKGKLKKKLLESENELKSAQSTLGGLAKLPDGFESADDLLKKLENKKTEQNYAQDSIHELEKKLWPQTEKLDGRRGDDATEAVTDAKRKFDMATNEGQCYLEIKTQLGNVTKDQDEAMFANYTKQVVDLFSRITDGETELEFDGQVPSQVVRGDVKLQPELLSTGGVGALAFAVRLAMAQAYLDNGGGFLMFDDPLVNFDPLRMANAAKTIQEISKSAQVIYFTCHKHHCEALAGKEIAI